MAGFRPFWPDPVRGPEPGWSGRDPARWPDSGQIGRRNLADRIPAKVAGFRSQISATLTDVGFRYRQYFNGGRLLEREGRLCRLK
jgi:hypothetical protein